MSESDNDPCESSGASTSGAIASLNLGDLTAAALKKQKTIGGAITTATADNTEKNLSSAVIPVSSVSVNRGSAGLSVRTEMDEIREALDAMKMGLSSILATQRRHEDTLKVILSLVSQREPADPYEYSPASPLHTPTYHSLRPPAPSQAAMPLPHSLAQPRGPASHTLYGGGQRFPSNLNSLEGMFAAKPLK